MSEPASSLTLLIIDDNQGSLDLLSTALAQPGLEILTASNPEEGIDLFCARHPQIVLTDLVMPNLSGTEVLERIMEIDPATDVILMTAHYSTESAVEAIRKGASDYLNKPVSIGALRERIGKVVKEARKRQRSVRLKMSCGVRRNLKAWSAAARRCGTCSRAFDAWRRTTVPC